MNDEEDPATPVSAGDPTVSDPTEPATGQVVLHIENLKESFDSLQERSAKAMADLRERTRQLAFIGIATAWLFRQGTRAEPQMASVLVWAAIAFCGALAVDLAQTLLASIGWLREKRRMERNPMDPSLKPPLWPLEEVIVLRAVLSRRSRYTWTFTYGAVLLVVVGYTLVGRHLFGLLRPLPSPT